MSSLRITAMCALAAGVLLLAGCMGRNEVAIAAKDDKIRHQDQELAQSRAEKEDLANLNAGLAKQNQELAERNAAKLAEMEAVMKDLGAKPQQSNAVQGAGDNEITVERDQKEAIHIKVASTMFFDPGQAILKHSAAETLKKVAGTLKTKFPNNVVRIEGHTDSTPIVHQKEKFKSNMELSTARAQSVYDCLVKDGVPASRLYMAGYGDQQPLVTPEKTATDRAKNRRVEIVIMPNDVKVQKEPLVSMKTTVRESAKK